MTDRIKANKAVAFGLLTEVHTGNTVLEDIYTRGYVHHNDAFYPGPEPGLDKFKRTLHSRAGGITDLSVRIDHLVSEGDKVLAASRYPAPIAALSRSSPRRGGTSHSRVATSTVSRRGASPKVGDDGLPAVSAATRRSTAS